MIAERVVTRGRGRKCANAPAAEHLGRKQMVSSLPGAICFGDSRPKCVTRIRRQDSGGLLAILKCESVVAISNPEVAIETLAQLFRLFFQNDRPVFVASTAVGLRDLDFRRIDIT